VLNDEKNYKFGIFYYNQVDQRFLLDATVKSNRNAPSLGGRIINFAHPIGKLIGILMLVFLVGAIVHYIHYS